MPFIFYDIRGLIAKSDLAKVHAAWSDYCAGKISRAEMTELSQNTSYYIFSILRWQSGS